MARMRFPQVLEILLENSCSNPYFPEDYFEKESYSSRLAKQLQWNDEHPDEPQKRRDVLEGYNGWNIYHVELHCTAYDIIARKRNDKWQIMRMEQSDYGFVDEKGMNATHHASASATAEYKKLIDLKYGLNSIRDCETE